MRSLIAFVFFIVVHTVSAQHTFRFEVLSGAIYNFPTQLVIRQDGYETINMTARYRSEPFKLPPYYDFRLCLWKRDSSAWGLKFTHHKILLNNTNDIVKRFEITHGYNIFSVNRFWHRRGFIFVGSLGAIVANPQSLIRDLYFQGGGIFNRGYYISGIIGEAAIGKKLNITRDWYLMAEIRGTAAWARVKVHSGYADVPNTAVHFLVGTGYNLLTRNNRKWNLGGVREE